MTKPAQTLRIHTVHRGDGACLRSVAQYVWPLALAVVPASRACAPDHASRPTPAAEPARATHDTIAVDTATGAAGEHTTPPHRSRVRRHAAPKPLPPGAVTHDWAAFLGPTHNAVSSETHLLRDWPDTGPTLLWEMHAGTGYASPAVVGDRLVYFHRIGDVETIECLHPETGEYYWSYSYPATYKDRYGFNNGPRSSPVIAHDLVFTHGAAGVMHAVDLRTGNVVWRRDLSAEFNVPQNYFGVGSTPLVHGRLVIINVGGRRGDDDNAQPYPCVVALDTRTGKTVWAGGDQWGASYASPVPATIHGEDRIIVLAGGDSRPPTGGLLSLDPGTGHIDWRFPFRSRKYESVNAATPVVVGHQVFVSSAYRTGGSLIDIRPDGTHAIAWNTNALRCHFGTPVHHD
ncbi:MAG: PQQ-binding-like beta-propeller repeat protein, partial [Phycisphaerae bacterium]